MLKSAGAKVLVIQVIQVSHYYLKSSPLPSSFPLILWCPPLTLSGQLRLTSCLPPCSYKFFLFMPSYCYLTCLCYVYKDFIINQRLWCPTNELNVINKLTCELVGNVWEIHIIYTAQIVIDYIHLLLQPFSIYFCSFSWCFLRARFELLCTPIFNKCIQPIRPLLEKVKLTTTDISKVWNLW